LPGSADLEGKAGSYFDTGPPPSMAALLMSLSPLSVHVHLHVLSLTPQTGLFIGLQLCFSLGHLARSTLYTNVWVSLHHLPIGRRIPSRKEY
jgi:hypothetical protein